MDPNYLLTILAALFVAGGCLLIVVAAVTILVVVHKRRQDRVRDAQWEQVVHGTQPAAAPAISSAAVISSAPASQAATLIETTILPNHAPGPNAIAVLRVLQSKDAGLIHRSIELTKPVTSLGRKSTNDIIFAKDSLVSREHARIEQRQGQFFLSEVTGKDEEGLPKRPAFGTFVDGKQIQAPTRLQQGSEIRLDTSVSLRVEYLRPWSMADDRTVDLNRGEMNKTVDEIRTKPG